jgi:pimeloyl-ACP methyl ester carboxylesterase
MRETTSHRLKAPGATLYYEVRGAGPVLLLIPGGPTDAGIFAALTACLADRYTVVAYDPRGNSRSTLDGAREDQQLDVHGDDAARLITSVGDGPAYVFGSSGGAQIGLDLATRHPERVRALVAHEPPCLQMLPDASRAIAEMRAVLGIYRREGVGPALQRFAELTGLSSGPAPSDESSDQALADEVAARIDANMDYFLAHGVAPISLYVPDVAALRAGPARVVVGVGEASAGQLAHRSALALAERLEREPVVFPGDHGGFGSCAAAFAETLHRVSAAHE